MRTVLLLIGSVGCASGASGAPDASAFDASPSDSAPSDSAPETCDPTAAFGAPVLVSGLATSYLERTVSLSPDELTVYFTGWFAGDTTQELYTAQRPNLAATFGIPDRLESLGSSSMEFAPSISADGLTLVFASSRVAGEGYHLYVATRSSTLADFGASALLGGVGSPTVTDTDTQPFLTSDGQEMWFVSDRTGTHAVLRAARVGAGFSNPIVVPEVSFAEGSEFPVVSADRLTIYFASQRVQAGTQGGFDVWTSHRSSVASSFPPPTLVAEVSSGSDDEPAWLSADNCRLYLESDRSGTMDIYVATRLSVR